MLRTLLIAGWLFLPTATFAADAAPALKGTWSGKFDFIIFGNNTHHPGAQGLADLPRTGAISYTFDVEGQDGNRLWGKSWSDPATKEPFAWMVAPSGKTIMGSDTDGVFQITILSADSLELCYAHPGTSPSGSILASCGDMTRAK